MDLKKFIQKEVFKLHKKTLLENKKHQIEKELNFLKESYLSPEEYRKKLEKLAWEEFQNNYDTLSDLDYSYNKQTGEYDIPSIEWDGPYGKHWVRFDSEEERTEALEKYNKNVKDFTEIFIKQKEEERQKRRAEYEANRNTIGNLFPDLSKLK
jgi:hypothetical protein